jgi:hypothetical protein
MRIILEEKIACIKRKEEHTELWWENLKEKEHLKDLDMHG